MKKNKNTCYTYFSIVGDFDPDEITKMLNLTPYESWKIGQPVKYGNDVYSFARWSFGYCGDYNVYVDEQMKQTISKLKDKIDVLCTIKDLFDVDFVLEIVPCVYRNESPPCLAPNREIIEFCYLTGTDIDIDLYLG